MVLLILVSKAEKKARIETGYGMEGVLPDILAKQIIDQRMIPFFKQNDYYRGFDNTVDAIIQAAAGEYKADPNADTKGKPSVGTIIILGDYILRYHLCFFRRRRRWRRLLHEQKRFEKFSWRLPWFLLGNMLGGGGRGGGGGFGGGGFGGGGGGGFGGFGGGGGGGVVPVADGNSKSELSTK